MKNEDKLIQKINDTCDYKPNFELIRNKIEYKEKEKRNYSLLFKRIGLSFACVLVLMFGFAMIIIPNLGYGAKNEMVYDSYDPADEESYDQEIKNYESSQKESKAYTDEAIINAFKSEYDIDVTSYEEEIIEGRTYYKTINNDKEYVVCEDDLYENEN